jgi:PII-like signaling protein
VSRVSGTSAASDGNETNETAPVSRVSATSAASDVLKLTAYFAERERSGGRFLAESMLDLFGARGVATSMMLRGIASFGPRNIVRSDESLAMSEDLPVCITAVDSPERIGALADDVVEMTDRGLITVERAQLGSQSLADGPDAVKMTLYLGRHRRITGSPAHFAACDIFHRLGFAGATVFLGVDGTVRGQRRRARFFSSNADVPVMVVAVGTRPQAESAAAEFDALLAEPLLTVERAQVCKRDGRLVTRPPALPQVDAQGLDLFQAITVHTDEATHHDGVPIHRALVRRLRESHHVSGATALRGIWGFHGDHAPHGDKLFQYGRSVPVSTVIIDTPTAIQHSFDIIDELTGEHGLVTSEVVPAMLALDHGQRRGGTRLGRYLR